MTTVRDEMLAATARDQLLSLGAAECLGHSDERETWLRARSGGIGASEIATLLGINRFETAAELLDKKLGRAEKKFQASHAGFGTLVEPAILEMHRRKTKRTAVECGWLFRSIDVPCLIATPDGVQWSTQHDGPGLVELKFITSAGAPDWGWGEYAPDHYVLQVQHQLLVTDAQWASISAAIDGVFRTFDIAADPKQQQRIIEAAETFWARVELERACQGEGARP